MTALARSRTIAEWIATGYQGLRIPRCPECRAATWRSWNELDAEAEDDVIEVAHRMRCEVCGLPPTGLAVVASAGR